MRITAPLAVLLFAAALPAAAATVACPDLATATQVAACPSEDELRYTFTGYCSDDRRMYARDTDVCADYANYRKLKNIALWESADGAFSAYVSCDRAPAGVKAAKPALVRVAKQGKITQVVCGYGEGLDFTYRTRAACRVDAAAKCTDAAACKAECDAP